MARQPFTAISEEGKRFCPNCGETRYERDLFCYFCGYEFPKDEEELGDLDFILSEEDEEEETYSEDEDVSDDESILSKIPDWVGCLCGTIGLIILCGFFGACSEPLCEALDTLPCCACATTTAFKGDRSTKDLEKIFVMCDK